MKNKLIKQSELFRLPWTQGDNAILWLEPTRYCNIHCDACFHFNDSASAKPLDIIEYELHEMLKLSRCDAVQIAGGEPLTHPEIVEIVRLVKTVKKKPILMTNGVGLDKSLLIELKKAGLFGCTVHIDSHQHRPEWDGKNELELNALRQYYADLLFEIGDLSCGYNTTIFPDTIQYVPDIVKWAHQNASKVHVLSLIAVRMIHNQLPFDIYAGDKKVELNNSCYYSNDKYKFLKTEDIYNEILKALPEYKFSGYLGGTIIQDSFKWALGCHICTSEISFGNIGRKTMELFQNVNHLIVNNYLAYTKTSFNKQGKLLLSIFWIFDSSIRKAFKNFLSYFIKKPILLFKKVFIQSIVVTQPMDILPNGELNHCDGCPNKTFWNGRLVSACRLEEYMTHGKPFHWAPKKKHYEKLSVPNIEEHLHVS